MTILGLTCLQSRDEAVIRRAWKQSVRRSHPDKQDQAQAQQATQQTQRLNQAKDVLLGMLAKESVDSDLIRREAALYQARKAALQEELAREQRNAKFWANIAESMRKSAEAAAKMEADRKMQAHQERAEYQRTFIERMRSYSERARKRARQSKSTPAASSSS